MVPIARAFDSVRALCLALLPTIALTFAFNALIDHGAMFAVADDDEVAPVDDIMTTTSVALPIEMRDEQDDSATNAFTGGAEQDDAATNTFTVGSVITTTAAIVFDNDDVDAVESFDRAKQCCMGQARRLYYGPRWHWMIP